MKKIFLLFIMLIINLRAQTDYTKYVDPFIGTSEHGHTYPGASLPFGMIQLSPDTGIEDWDWCSGYHSSDSSIIGFSHTHLSGTGASDYGDILFMPFIGDIKFSAGLKENPDEGYRSRFNHESEKASPGYYSVFLDDYKTKVELTTTLRSGFHKYLYPKNEKQKLVVDLVHGIHDSALEGFFKITDKNKIEGYRTSTGWAKKHTIYFYAEFSKNISNQIIKLNKKNILESIAKGKFVKAALEFEDDGNTELLVKIGISHVSIEGAKNNLLTEIPEWNFDKVKNEAKEKWNNRLKQIEVEGGTKEQKITYYTSLYHAFLAPNIFSDVDRKYIGMDGKVKVAEDFDMYTIFSLWDTFRALHPLMTILDEKITIDFIKSMLAKFDESGALPIWELASNETGTMIGYHAIPVIVDAYMKDIRNFDIQKAYRAMKKSAMEDDRGLSYYKSMGFIPMDMADDAVSRTLEYAYDDWCIAQMAKELKKEDDYKYFMSRAKNYVNVFDPITKFMRGRYNSGAWSKNFDPIVPSYLGSGEFTEGNSWQYSWFVPQDVTNLINLIGGDEKFVAKLDSLFIVETDYEKYKMPSDVTGLIGQYAQGNEPSHHISYLYNYAGVPWKTQEIIRKIMSEFFHSGRDGLCGNEDCGQMSAWYAFSAIGFYPVLPGSNEYVLGSSIFDKVKINLPNGKIFTLNMENNSSENKYIQSIKLNGKEYKKSFFTHDNVLDGSTFTIQMSNKPNKDFGREINTRPNSKINESVIALDYKKYFMPEILPERSLFANQIKVEIISTQNDAKIKYTTDGTEPCENSYLYNGPLVLEESIVLKTKVFGDKFQESETASKKFTKSIVRDSEKPYLKMGNEIYPLVVKNENYHSSYPAQGKNSLIDGIFARKDFRNPNWLGFEVKNCDVIIDLGKQSPVQKISANFLEKQDSWIFAPKKITVSFSKDGKNYSEPILISENIVKENDEIEIKRYCTLIENTEARYIHFVAENIGKCPDFHKGAGGKAWLFIDEVIIQ